MNKEPQCRPYKILNTQKVQTLAADIVPPEVFTLVHSSATASLLGTVSANNAPVHQTYRLAITSYGVV